MATADDNTEPYRDGPPDPHDRYTKYLTIASASAILFIAIGYPNTYGVFQSHYESALFRDVPPDQLITIGSVAASLYFILAAFTGRFADLVGHRVSLCIGGALMIGSLFAASVSKTFWQLFCSQGVGFGLGVAFVYPVCTTVSRQHFGRGHGVANGVVVSGGALGGCILPFVVKIALERYGLPSTSRILGYLAIGVLVPSIALLKPKSAQTPYATRRKPLMDLTLLHNTRFLLLLTTCTVAMTGFLPRYFLIPTSAISVGIDPNYASWLLGLMNGLSILGRIGVGYVADRFGKVQALSASFILCGVGHIIFWLPGVTINADSAGTPTALFTLFVVYTGIFGSGFISLFPVVVAHLFGAEFLASKTGLLNTAIGLSVVAGPSAVYAIVGNGSSMRWMAGVLTAGMVMFVGGAALLACSMAMEANDRKRRDSVRV